MLRNNWYYKRGDLYMANLNPHRGSEQGGTRPVVVLQNNAGNFFCPTVIIAPLTTVIKKKNLPTHYYIKKAKGLPEPSMVELEQVRTIDKCRIIKYLGKVDQDQLSEIDECLKESLGIYIPECEEAP